MAKQKLTKETFVNKCKIIHNNLYDYSKVDYINSRSNVEIVCPIHGSFFQRASSHLEGRKCPKCNYRRSKSIEEVLSKIKDIHKNKYKYTNSISNKVKDKIKIICPIHGEFEQELSEHLRGRGCSKCAKENLKLDNKKFIQKAKNIHREKYEYKDINYLSSKDKIKIICPIHGGFYQRPNNHLMGQNCPKCSTYISKAETEAKDFLKNNKFEFLENNRIVINPKELDIYIPSKSIAIELNGNYWHSELQGKDKNYHLNKTIDCENNNIILLHFFESEWIYKKDICKSIINSKLGNTNRIYARKCKIVSLDSKTKNEFLDKNHIQGKDRSNFNIGLLYNDDLVSTMTFIKSRFNKNYEWELSRYCNLLDTTVVGGAGKLLNYFKHLYRNNSIVSYANRRYSNGNLYKQLGFEFSHYSKPNYFYFHKSNCYELLTRHQFQKHKLRDKLEYFDPKLSEWDNMKLNGYDRIWDCGNGVWKLI